MILEERFDREPVAVGWSATTRAAYLAFANGLMRDEPLAVTFGKGGLSFYKETARGRVFVCHHNAAPRGGAGALGFADFRQDTLGPLLDLPAAFARLRAALGAADSVRVGKVWCSFHFPQERGGAIADALREALVAPLR